MDRREATQELMRRGAVAELAASAEDYRVLLDEAVGLLREYNHELSHYLCLADETLAVFNKGKAFLARVGKGE